MIDELRIKDLGVIADAVVPLGPGFTAITGETGAGKTMVVTALGLLMGQRSDSGLVRDGTAQARVAGAIQLPPVGAATAAVTEIVTDCGGALEDGELLLTRTVAGAGNSRASVGGVRAPSAVLQQLSEKLFCVHGQADQLRLKSQAQQRETLDRFGGAELAAALQTYQELYVTVQQLQLEHQEITENWQQRRRLTEQLQAETAEILAVDPQPDEKQQLQQHIDKLNNAEELQYALHTALHALSGADGGEQIQADTQTLLARARSAVLDAAAYEPQLTATAAALEEAAALVQSATGELLSHSEELTENVTAELTTAQERYAALIELERKYGPELSDVLQHLATASDKLLTLDSDDSRLQELTEQLAVTTAAQEAAAMQLRELRQTAAAALSAAVTTEMQQLALADSSLVIEVIPAPATQHGADEVLFLLQPHPQATPRPLAKAASGGELSRIMLALEVVLAQVSPVPTFVFDEIDAGIGGAAAIEVGKRLARLARSSQVIVVTHLAQVAAFAGNHLRVLKDSSGGFTKSSCVQLADDARLQEIARLLSGLTDSESALTHAAELIAMGQQEGY